MAVEDEECCNQCFTTRVVPTRMRVKRCDGVVSATRSTERMCYATEFDIGELIGHLYFASMHKSPGFVCHLFINKTGAKALRSQGTLTIGNSTASENGVLTCDHAQTTATIELIADGGHAWVRMSSLADPHFYVDCKFIVKK